MKTTAGWNRPPIAEWKDGHSILISCVFSWDASEVLKRAQYYESIGRRVRIGGPAVRLNPQWFGEYGDRGDHDALPYHNERATFTSRGCPRKCAFCAVPTTEGDLVELKEWEPKPIVCDNNLLACSRKHFDLVIDRLRPLSGVDFNQGLDGRLLKSYHAGRIAELDMKTVRLAWDHTTQERRFMEAWRVIREAGIPKSRISVYILMGWRDDPADALYRITTVRSLGGYPSPMRYQPLDSRKRNQYVCDNWTDWELKAYMRYWTNLRFTSPIPFDEWLDTYRHRESDDSQLRMLEPKETKP